jgi:hypothetical protein
MKMIKMSHMAYRYINDNDIELRRATSTSNTKLMKDKAG